MNALRLGSEPAFPCVEVAAGMMQDGLRQHSGVSKRELFAALALQALITRWTGKEMPLAVTVPIAVACADALLEELAK